jgi:soluble lytic murein transglycosylase-like protein
VNVSVLIILFFGVYLIAQSKGVDLFKTLGNIISPDGGIVGPVEGNAIYTKYKFPIDSTSALRNIPRERITAIIAVESSGNAHATGAAQERGLMQVTVDPMIEVNTRYGYSFSFDEMYEAEKNILVGTTYLSWLRDQLFHDLDTGTQAYNVGLYSVQVNPKLGLGYLHKVQNYESTLTLST